MGYDEFGLFHENISEFGLEVSEIPQVARVETSLPDDSSADESRRTVSALKWGSKTPELVLIDMEFRAV